MNDLVNTNFEKVKWPYFYLPLLLLIMLTMFLYVNNAWSVDNYILVQKEAFFVLNSTLSVYPKLMQNLTQLGDTLIILSLLSVLLIYCTRVFGAILSSSFLSAVLCCSLKWIFKVPRPAAVFDTDKFIRIGDKLVGSNSLPSGHAMTVFMTLTVILMAFMPKRVNMKALWISAFLFLTTSISLTRIGVGAHYILDVIMGGTIGYISGIAGIIISQKYMTTNSLPIKYYYPLLIILFFTCICILLLKIFHENLFIFYFSFLSLLISLHITVYKQIKLNKTNFLATNF